MNLHGSLSRAEVERMHGSALGVRHEVGRLD
jgi:hypothetical protein